MNLSKIVIVLARPEDSANVGAVCRAMANNDITELRIVGKRQDFDEGKVRTVAIHASRIWENCGFYDSIRGATKDCAVAAGTTRRRGKKRKKLLLPEEFCDFASAIAGTKNQENATGKSCSDGGKVAVVFGNERTGLTDNEFDECTIGVTIPTSKNFASLNLSHAVQIICRQFFMSTDKSSCGYTPITLARLDETVKSIADNFQNIGFFSLAGRIDMENFWRMILSRAALSEGEACYIEKTFSKMAGLARKNEKNKSI